MRPDSYNKGARETANNTRAIAKQLMHATREKLLEVLFSMLSAQRPNKESVLSVTSARKSVVRVWDWRERVASLWGCEDVSPEADERQPLEAAVKQRDWGH
jgi:hypothetical protein